MSDMPDSWIPPYDSKEWAEIKEEGEAVGKILEILGRVRTKAKRRVVLETVAKLGNLQAES